MTIHDLSRAGIIDKSKATDIETALLFLNYNEKICSDKNLFFSLKSNLMKKFNNLQGLDENLEKEFLSYAVAIIDKELQEVFMKHSDNAEKILQAHKFCVNKESLNLAQNESESIAQARNLAKVCDSLEIRGKQYSLEKDQYLYMKDCVNDEGVFDSFYSRIEGRVDKKNARQMVNDKLATIEKDFLQKQDKYLKFLVNYQIKEDVRLNLMTSASAV